MRAESKKMLKDSVIPVILGDNAGAHLLALRIFLSCGVVSYVCSAKRSFLSFIDPFAKHFPLFCESGSTAALESLFYIASSPDYLPMLIPCTKEFSALISENSELLESRFIISDRQTALSSSLLSDIQRKAGVYDR